MVAEGSRSDTVLGQERLGDCRSISLSDFKLIESKTHRPFDVDACASDGGRNALCSKYYSPSDSFLRVSDLSDKHVWMNAPFHLIYDFVSHYLKLKAKSPSSVTACILVPRWPGAKWGTLLQGMQKIMEFPAGYPLFEIKTNEKKNMPAIPWPVDIFYDAPYQPLAIKSANGGDDSQMVMQFKGTISGVPGIFAMDTQASHCFIDQAFVLKHGLRTQPVHRMVELADGSHVLLSGECTINIRMPTPRSTASHRQKLSCYVVPLGADHNIILGQDWLVQVGAELSYARNEVTLSKSGVTLKPLVSRRPPPPNSAVLSYVKIKREIRKAAKCFMVHVTPTEPPDKPQGSEFEQQIPSSVSDETRQVLLKYQKVFGTRTGLPPDRGIGHVIPETPGSKPVYVPPYRLSPLEVAEVEKQVKELLLLGLIEPSSSPYGAPILFVQKKGGSLRMCCDWRRLNAQTIKSRYPLPRIDYLLDQLHGASVFTSLDLLSGYHQILIDPADVPKTAFTTPFGHYQFKVMSFGLSNAPATFQAVMNKLFHGLKGVLVYMDDILIFTKTKEEHVALLDKVLRILEQNEFFVRMSKCDFERSELKYLGHIVSGEGIKVDPAKIQVIENWPRPSSQKEVRSFLGLANYFRKFIQGYSALASPLIRLTRKEVSWSDATWTDNCQKSFDGLKHALAHAPVLAIPDFTKPFTMEVVCDASLTGVGAVLMQEGRPLAYESRRLSDAEVKWTTTEQECWAVVHALKQWRCYLEGVPFTVVTDHHPNVFFQTQKNLSRRQARWSEYLQRFDFTWSYRPGRQNVADPLSRVVPVVLNAITLRAVTTRRAAAANESSRLPPPPKLPPPPLPLPPSKRHKRSAGAHTTELVLGDSPQSGVTMTMVDSPGQGTQLPRTGVTSMGVDSPAEGVTPRAGLVDDSLRKEVVTSNQNSVVSQMQAGYAADPWFSDQSHLSLLSQRDGLWWKGNLVVVPDVPGLRHSILYELHDAPYSGHPGITKTMKAVQRLYWWPSLRDDVQTYVSTCASCQRNKAVSHKPAGLLQPLPIPDSPWESVSMDFIVQLPKTTRGFDAIVVFVDRLTKMVHIAPTHTSVTAEGTAELFLDHVFKLHGMPSNIVTDRGSVFMGHFWSELMRLIGTRHSPSTAYHPQSDGQTERVNRVLEDMLRHYVGSLRHGDWDRCLSAAEFAINQAYHESIGTTPFFLNSGRNPRLPISISSGSKFPAPARFADRIAEGLAEAKRCLQAAQQRQKRHYDVRRRDLSFSEGEEVLLSTKNINLRRTGDKGSTPKLLPKWIGPFTVSKVIGKGAYQLDLPENMSIHNVFHVSLLQPYRSDGRVQPPDPIICEEDGEAYFEIERVLDHRINKRGRRVFREYLVKWLGYGSEHNSWEPESSLISTDQLKLYWDYVGLESPIR